MWKLQCGFYFFTPILIRWNTKSCSGRFSSTTTVCIARRWRATCFKCWSSCVTLYPRRRVWQTDGLYGLFQWWYISKFNWSQNIYTHSYLCHHFFFFLNHFKSFCFQVMWLNRHLRFYNRNFLFCIRSTFVIVFFFFYFPLVFFGASHQQATLPSGILKWLKWAQL